MGNPLQDKKIESQEDFDSYSVIYSVEGGVQYKTFELKNWEDWQFIQMGMQGNPKHLKRSETLRTIAAEMLMGGDDGYYRMVSFENFRAPLPRVIFRQVPGNTMGRSL